MAYDWTDRLVIAVSPEVLFVPDQKPENDETKWEKKETAQTLKPGPAFPFISGLLELKKRAELEERIEVILVSGEEAGASMALYRALAFYEVKISRFLFTGGSSPVPYLQAFCTDLFLSFDAEAVQEAADGGIAAGLMWETERKGRLPDQYLRLAFDGDAVLFSDDSERIYREQGLETFEAHETEHAGEPLAEGPFAGFLKKLTQIRRLTDTPCIRTALVTARCAPAHERVIRTLKAWDVDVDEMFFLGGLPKKEILDAFGAQLFFDDQRLHVVSAAEFVPAALVPCRQNRKEKTGRKHEIRQYSGGHLSGASEPVYRLRGTWRQEGDGPCKKYGQMP